MDMEPQFSLNQPQPKSCQTGKSATAQLSGLSNLHRSSSGAVVKAIRQAEDRPEGGTIVYLHSSAVSSKELRTTLETLFPGSQQYSVQLRRDRYRVTLPNYSKDQIQHVVSR